MEEASTKSSRLELIKLRLSQKPKGYTTGELADELSVPQRTVLRDIITLSGEPHNLPIETVNRRHRLKPGYKPQLAPIVFNAEEAATLFIAARLLDQHSGSLAPMVYSSLIKLAKALPAEVSNYLLKSIGTNNQVKDNASPDLVSFVTIVNGWLSRYKVLCEHSTLKGPIKTYTLAPYTLEPSAVGYAVYVRGQCDEDPLGRLRTLKLERIRKATLTQQSFELPEVSGLGQLSPQTWHIWDSDEPPLEVHLRFSSKVVARLKETIWHPGQKLIDQPDGKCDWLAEVAEPKEMLPWIRGWGADCEILAPSELRNELILEARRLAKLYKLNQPETPSPEQSQSDRLKNFGQKFFKG